MGGGLGHGREPRGEPQRLQLRPPGSCPAAGQLAVTAAAGPARGSACCGRCCLKWPIVVPPSPAPLLLSRALLSLFARRNAWQVLGVQNKDRCELRARSAARRLLSPRLRGCAHGHGQGNCGGAPRAAAAPPAGWGGAGLALGNPLLSDRSGCLLRGEIIFSFCARCVI